MKKYIMLGFLTLINWGCMQKSEVNTDNIKQEIMDTDLEFSDVSVREGISAAFIKYAADDVVLLRDKRFPIIGIDSLKEAFRNRSSANLLEWKPWKAEAAASGDLGYTIGNWRLTTEDSSANKQLFYGNYFTVWKKINGKWKYVLDGGNDTPEIKNF